MATVPTPKQAARRILWLMVHKYKMRENEIAHLGQFLVSFANGSFRNEDFQDGADYAISQGWVVPANMGTMSALRLTEAGFAAAPNLEERREKRVNAGQCATSLGSDLQQDTRHRSSG
jgi:hypothetical protein